MNTDFAINAPLGATPPSPTYLGCFTTFRDAILVATNGRVDLPPSVGPTNVSNSMLNAGAAGPDTSAVIGIDYDGQYDSGNSFVVSESQVPIPCTNNTIAELPNLWNIGGQNWNDRIRSDASYGNCGDTYLYENTNYGGSVLDTYFGYNTLGIMDKQASSIKWTP